MAFSPPQASPPHPAHGLPSCRPLRGSPKLPDFLQRNPLPPILGSPTKVPEPLHVAWEGVGTLGPIRTLHWSQIHHPFLSVHARPPTAWQGLATLGTLWGWTNPVLPAPPRLCLPLISRRLPVPKTCWPSWLDRVWW